MTSILFFSLLGLFISLTFNLVLWVVRKKDHQMSVLIADIQSRIEQIVLSHPPSRYKKYRMCPTCSGTGFDFGSSTDLNEALRFNRQVPNEADEA